MMLSARNVGIGAAEALRPGGGGRVVAAFGRSLYLRCNDALLCVGADTIGSGPINIPCEVAPSEDWRDFAMCGDPVSFNEHALIIGDTAIAVGTAPVWTPTSLPGWCRAGLSEKLAELEVALPPVLPAGGLGICLREESAKRADSAVFYAAAPAIDALQRWARNEVSDQEPDWIVGELLGLGPGLTPSGDDFLGGFLAALAATGRRDRANVLAHCIGRLGAEGTNEISLAHLNATIRFGLCEVLHNLLWSLLDPGREKVALAMGPAVALSNHSPWDALAGIVECLKCETCSSRDTRE